MNDLLFIKGLYIYKSLVCLVDVVKSVYKFFPEFELILSLEKKPPHSFTEKKRENTREKES